MYLWENSISGCSLVQSMLLIWTHNSLYLNDLLKWLHGKLRNGSAFSDISINSEMRSTLYAISAIYYKHINDFHVTIHAVDKAHLSFLQWFPLRFMLWIKMTMFPLSSTLFRRALPFQTTWRLEGKGWLSGYPSGSCGRKSWPQLLAFVSTAEIQKNRGDPQWRSDNQKASK